MDFKTRLKELRSEKNLTQKELAACLGLTANCICEWEKGRSEPGIESLQKLVACFGCSIDYLVGIEDDFGNVVVQNNSTPELRSVEKDLLACFRKLPEDLQRRATSYLKKLVELNEEELSPGDSKKFQ